VSSGWINHCVKVLFGDGFTITGRKGSQRGDNIV
jgi:hypothetical protein